MGQQSVHPAAEVVQVVPQMQVFRRAVSAGVKALHKGRGQQEKENKPEVIRG